MKSYFPRLAPVFAALSILQISPIRAQGPLGKLCANGECQPAIAPTKYGARKAFALTNGRVEAIIVPEIGRVMRFGKIGGPNLLWNLSGKPAAEGWKNHGGDKTWLAPQSSWKQFHGKSGWPPDEAFDGKSHLAEVLSGGKLRLSSPLSPTGIRLVRTMYFDRDGDFVIEQMARKERGAALEASIWSITQIVPGTAIFLPVAPNSTYVGGFRNFDNKPTVQTAALVKSNMVRFSPISQGGGIKFGSDARVSSIASVRDGMAFVQKTAQPAGKYADAEGKNAGVPIELYINGDKSSYYAELELLGPLKTLAVGGKSTQTVRWSLHDMPSKDANSPAVADAVEKLLFAR